MGTAALRSSTALFAIVLAACGGGAASTTEPTEDTTAGQEAEPVAEPPPPPPPARVRLIHASADPAAASVSLTVDDAATAITGLAFRSGSAYVEVPAGHHAIAGHGVPSVETGDAPTLVAHAGDFASERAYTGILVSQDVADAPFMIHVAPDADAPPAEGSAALRLFHAIVGVDAVDVCVAGATPRDPATAIAANVEPSAISAYGEAPASGELAVQLRQPGGEACRGRVLGVARFTPTAGTSYTLVAVGRTTGRPRVDRELVVCSDAADGTCTAVPIGNR